MSNPAVRELGTVTDVHGRTLRIGVDHDAVTLGDFMFGPEVRDDFARLFFAADEDAKAWAAANAEEEADGCPIAVVFGDGMHSCILQRGHDGDHDYADEPDPF